MSITLVGGPFDGETFNRPHDGIKTFTLPLWDGKCGEGVPSAVVYRLGADGRFHYESWTEAKNARRCALINRKYSSDPTDADLTEAETAELAALRAEHAAWLESVSPMMLPPDALMERLKGG